MYSAYTVEVRNRCKRLDLIDRVPEELWMEVRDIVQKAVIKIILKKKKCKKAKWLSEEALKISEKRREEARIYRNFATTARQSEQRVAVGPRKLGISS